MKILVPPLKISETDGFKQELDIFNRKAYGESLLNLISNTEDELVLALDAPWGEGKSTFIKMWRGFLTEKGIASVYFDAFENDYQQDPLLAISSQLYELIDKSDSKTQTEFKKKALSALKIVGRAGIKIGIKALTAGVLDDTIFDDTDSVEDVSDEASEMVDKFIETQITKAEENRKSLSAFKDYLSSLGGKLGDGKNLIFIIDELDRCKPNFALAILESIKHLFSVPNITFVLVMNRTQLEEAVRCEYGRGVDASKYLQKFVSIWASLPNSMNQHISVPKSYLQNCLTRMEYRAATKAHQNAIQNLEELVEFYDLPLREIEKSLTNFAIIHNATDDGDLNSDYLLLAVFISVIKVINPELYQKLSRKTITYNQLIKEANLERLSAHYWHEEEAHPLRWLLKYELSSDDDAAEMVKNLKNYRGFRQGAIANICLWLDSFKR